VKIAAPNQFAVSGQTDVALISKNFSLDLDWKKGVLLTIELKKTIVKHDFIQGQAECLIMAANSQFPVLQVSLLLSD
jgi:hypothetical protein